jgi:hypothetical protein
MHSNLKFIFVSTFILFVSQLTVFGSNVSDERLLDKVKEKTTLFFSLNRKNTKDECGAHPESGFIRDTFVLPNAGPRGSFSYDRCATGGTGMGLMALVVGVENQYVTRESAVNQILNMFNFLQNKINSEEINPGYKNWKGAFPHWMSGKTGKLYSSYVGDFTGVDDGADIVETSYFIQGVLVVHQYFNKNTPKENKLREMADKIWKTVDWNHYIDADNAKQFHWHCSSDAGNPWKTKAYVSGFNECMIVYILGLASPTHPIPVEAYYEGWAGNDSYKKPIGTYLFFGNLFSEQTQIIQQPGWGYRMPIFWTQYSFLGFDPDFNDRIIPIKTNKKNQYFSYKKVFTEISKINRKYCQLNPGGYAGYSNKIWGLTASLNPWGYGAQAPIYINNNSNIYTPSPARIICDNGTVTPTAAISSIIYTPDAALTAVKSFFKLDRNLKEKGKTGIWNKYGFVDAFNLNTSIYNNKLPEKSAVPKQFEELAKKLKVQFQDNTVVRKKKLSKTWISNSYLAIDQAPISIMLENHRTGLIWNLFMSHPDIKKLQKKLSKINYESDGRYQNWKFYHNSQ